MRRIAFILNMVPPKATHQSTSRAIIGKHGKPAVITNYKGKKIKEAFKTLVAPHAPSVPLDGALRLAIHFSYPWRKSEPKYRKALGSAPCHTKPDLDNLAKFMLDSLEGRFYLNDSQVSELVLSKSWSSNPHISIELSEKVIN